MIPMQIPFHKDKPTSDVTLMHKYRRVGKTQIFCLFAYSYFTYFRPKISYSESSGLWFDHSDPTRPSIRKHSPEHIAKLPVV